MSSFIRILLVLAIPVSSTLHIGENLHLENLIPRKRSICIGPLVILSNMWVRSKIICLPEKDSQLDGNINMWAKSNLDGNSSNNNDKKTQQQQHNNNNNEDNNKTTTTTTTTTQQQQQQLVSYVQGKIPTWMASCQSEKLLWYFCFAFSASCCSRSTTSLWDKCQVKSQFILLNPASL